MRLIDADELQQVFNETSTALMREPKLLKDIEHMVRAFLMATEMIKDAPTIEAEFVKHGRWITHDRYQYKCSECETFFRSESQHIKRKGEYLWDIEEPRFCPRCGARMDGDENAE